MAFAATATRLGREVDLRYAGQQWDVRVPLPAGTTAASVRTAFEAEHDRLYGHFQPDGLIEITKLHVVGTGLLPALAVAEPTAAIGPPAATETRSVWLDPTRGRQRVPVYAGGALRPGHEMCGPLLIEEETTTILVGPDDRISVDRAGNYVITLVGGDAEMTLDPVTLALTQNRLDHISRQMGWVMTRTARQPDLQPGA